MDIAEFLAARLGEDEQAARAAADGAINWEVQYAPFASDDWWVVRCADAPWSSPVRGSYEGGGCEREEDADHIARYDPARVLADVAAKRAVLAVHCTPAAAEPDDYRVSEHRRVGRESTACVGCGWGGPCDDYHVEDINQCPTLRALASVYADHPEFDPAWRSSSVLTTPR